MFGIGGAELLVLLAAIGVLLLVPGAAAFGLGYLVGRKSAPTPPGAAVQPGPAPAERAPSVVSALPDAPGDGAASHE